MFHHSQALFSAVSSVHFSSRGLFGSCMTGQKGHSESLINCGMNTERSLSLGGQAMSLHLFFLTLFHPPLCFSSAGREQTGTFFFHMPLPHTPSVKRNTRMLTGWATFPFPSIRGMYITLDLQDADLKARRNLSRPAYDIKLHSKKIGHNILFNLKEFSIFIFYRGFASILNLTFNCIVF